MRFHIQNKNSSCFQSNMICSLHTVCQCANCIVFFRQGVCELNTFVILTLFLVFVGLCNTVSVSCANSMCEVIKLMYDSYIFCHTDRQSVSIYQSFGHNCTAYAQKLISELPVKILSPPLHAATISHMVMDISAIDGR